MTRGSGASGEPVARTLERVRRRAHGMMPPEVYRALYERARAADGGDLLEIGTSHGAATIALALGLEGSGGVVHTVDRMEGGSASWYGDRRHNEAVVRENLRAFGVEERVELVVGDVERVGPEVAGRGPFSLLLLDADGAVDRDLRLFYDALIPGAAVIVDDYDPRVKVERRGLRSLRVDLKHLLTHHLVDFYVGEGLLEAEETVASTFIGRKPADATGPVDFGRLDVASAYRKCIFVDAVLPGPFRTAYQRLRRRFPRAALRAAELYRRLRGG